MHRSALVFIYCFVMGSNKRLSPPLLETIDGVRPTLARIDRNGI